MYARNTSPKQTRRSPCERRNKRHYRAGGRPALAGSTFLLNFRIQLYFSWARSRLCCDISFLARNGNPVPLWIFYVGGCAADGIILLLRGAPRPDLPRGECRPPAARRPSPAGRADEKWLHVAGGGRVNIYPLDCLLFDSTGLETPELVFVRYGTAL
ncbi:hypothetical protein EVAR_66240_1 [Eumeta japonica]|uniref:Uncharacterized protein n=1 Tax=Eumeta variegata TaxID=151549 RepID=A0A4C1ZVC3_EUMVA|nr:hypothetical protein EVAR_66240_1 [Eumeta japonica]